MKGFKILGLILLGLYVSACVVLYAIQDNLIFDPHPLSPDYSFDAGEEVNLEVADGIKLNCVWVKEAPHKGVILYLHGTRGNNRRCLYQARTFRDNGYDLFIPDYRGYGKSNGSVQSEKQLFQDVQKVYDFLKQHYEESKIVIAGYSLGTGFATHLAANNSPGQLVLISPFLSFADLKDQWLPIVPDFLIKYPMENEEMLKEVNCPVSLFHGTEDEVIPFRSSERLVELYPESVRLTPLPQTRHRRSIFHEKLRLGFSELLD